MIKPDFRKLLEKYAVGDRSDTKLEMQPTPSQDAIQQIGEGIDEIQGQDVSALAGGSGRPAIPLTADTGSNEMAPVEFDNPQAPPMNSGMVGSGRGTTGDDNASSYERPPMDTLLNNDVERAQTDYRNAVNMPVQKQKKWKDILAYIVQGADAAFNPGQGKKIEGYGKIKHDQEVRRKQEELAPLMQLQDTNTVRQQKASQAQAELRKTNAATQGTITENQYRQIKPLLDTYTADKKIDESEARTLSALTGLPYSPQEWQTLVDKEINGKVYSRPEFSSQAEVNTTYPVDPTEVPRNVQIGGGQSLPMTPHQAAPMIAGIENNNASRAQSASQFNTTQTRLTNEFNVTQEGKYAGDIRSYQTDLIKAKASIAKNAPVVKSTQATIDRLDQYIKDNSTFNTSTEEAQLAAAREKQAQAQGEIDAANIMMSVPAPTKPKNIPGTPKGKTRYTNADIERVIRQ